MTAGKGGSAEGGSETVLVSAPSLVLSAAAKQARRAAIATAFLISMVVLVQGRDLRADPVTGKIRVLYLGDAMGVPNPFPILSREPLLSCTAVYACTVHQTEDDIRKSVRVYMPRTYSRFLNNDVVILSDANRNAFRDDHLRWMRDGVVDEGLGLVMIGGAESFAQEAGFPSWKPTEVAEVLPCEMIPSSLSISGGSVRVLDWNDEFIRSLPFKSLGAYGFFSSSNNIQPRFMSHYIADLVRGMTASLPFLIWWDYGKGRTMAQGADWTPAGGSTFMGWPYYGDYAINMMLFLAGQRMPQDLDMVYAVRRALRKTNDALLTLYNMVDLIERFGANGDNVNRLILEIEGEKRRGMEFYVGASLDEALETFRATVSMCEAAMKEAIRARDDAAFWIFFTEWCAVTGTSLCAGSLLWVLMVRRAAYREIASTRLTRESC